MTNEYVEFISDSDLIWCIDKLYQGYKRALGSKDLKAFLTNRIDPIKFMFDAKVLDMDMEEYLQREVIRQVDKTISNYIGDFHEDILGKIDGYEALPVGNGIDLRSDDGKLVAEIKNKHNTVKGENLPDIFKKLQNMVKEDSNDVEKAYFVRIIDSTSRHNKWSLTSKGQLYEDEAVFITSGDRFYEEITGRPNAFSELCSILPRAFNDYLDSLSDEEKITTSKFTILDEIKNNYSSNNSLTDKELLTILFKINFPSYNGFDNFKIE